MRENYIHAHGVALQAIGMAGADLLSEHPDDWKRVLKKIKNIDWTRSNVNLWEGRAIVQGRISKAFQHVQLTSIYIKKVLGLTLSNVDINYEKQFIK